MVAERLLFAEMNMAMVFKSVLVWQHFLVGIGEKASVVGLVSSCYE